jgi:hypothetical protein
MRPVAVAAVCVGLVLQEYVYPKPGVPPPGVTVADPLLPPLQETFVCALMLAVKTVGSVIVAVVVAAQPFPSVTTTV